jgi:hypothetical protein
MRMKCLLTVATAIGAILAMTGTAVACPGGRHSARARDTASARAHTAVFHSIDVATHRGGYSLLTDAAGIACIDSPGVGGMGIHYVKASLVDDPTERAATPELLVYEPLKNGRLRLVALEYVVIQSAWEAAGNTRAPSLYGQQFTLTPAGNRFGLPAFYELHAWVWKHNPLGMFEDFNPRVSCAVA